MSHKNNTHAHPSNLVKRGIALYFCSSGGVSNLQLHVWVWVIPNFSSWNLGSYLTCVLFYPTDVSAKSKSIMQFKQCAHV